jgi:pimeloyl-ACP methyl ester carboxylesterase
MLTSDGTDLAVHNLGGSGDELLLVHGNGLCAQTLAPMAAALAGDHRSAGLDLRGHGRSGRPPNRDYAWPRIGRDVREVLDAAPAPPAVFGHSLGASAVLLAALERPDAVRSLCLFEPIILYPQDSASVEKMAQRAESRRAVFASRAEIEEHFSSRGFFAGFDPGAFGGYVDGGFRSQPDGTFVLALAPEDEAAIFRASVAPGIWDGLDVLADLDLEITVLCGSTSTGPTVVGAALLAERDPRVRVIELAGVGHFGPFEAPERVGEMVSTIFRASVGGNVPGPAS